jgi:hypothetical protein
MAARLAALIVAVASLFANSACVQTSPARAAFAPENAASLPDDAAAPQLLDRPFRGVPSTGSETTSPPPIPGSPPTAPR